MALALILSPTSIALAQVNSWLKPSSGDWHEPQWSLGVLPGSGQSVFITNTGWKAVAVTPVTAQNFPQSLTMHSLNVGSPVDSRNVLLLNYAGFGVPLTTRFCRVEANSAITIMGSAMLLNGGGGEGMSVGGEITHAASSIVTGQQIDVGYIGPGVYNLNSGTLRVNNLWIGGSSRGVFNQTGGSNGTPVIHLEGPGTYNLQGGDLNSDVYFENYYPYTSLLRQTGGAVHHVLTMHYGEYQLEGGINYAGVVAPIYAWGTGSALVNQTGGTNVGPLDIGFNGSGTYTLSNGISLGAIRLGGRGNFVQWGGNVTAPGNLSILGEWIGRNYWGLGAYTLKAGNVRCGGLFAEGNYTQDGGTNIVEGDILMQQSISLGVRFRQTGGVLRANSMTAFVGVVLSGGQLFLTNDLVIQGQDLSYYPWFGPELSITGGQLVVANISLRGNMAFTPGVIQQSGTFTLRNARLLPGSGSHQLGPLRLDIPNSTSPDSQILLPAGAPCTLRFGESRALPWTANARLVVTNWAGSISGGGAHQVRFGNSSGALTSQQLSQILFGDPVGFGAGLYQAKILATGEIVPGATTPLGAPTLQLVRRPDGTMQITVNGESGVDYGIDISSDLLNWQFWTNHVAQNGSLTVIDPAAATQPRRFYRAFVR